MHRQNDHWLEFASRQLLLALFFGWLLASPAIAQQKHAVGFDPLKHLAKAPGWLLKTEGKAFKKENVPAWGIAAGSVVLVYAFDDNLDRYFKRDERLPDITRFFDKTGHLLNQGLWAGFYLTGLLARDEKLVSAGQAMIIAELGANLVGGALWLGLGRERPDTAPNHHTFHPFDFGNLDLAFPPFKVLPSFPSSHVSGNFSIATVLTRYYGFKAGLPMYLFGAATGFSRMARQGHYLSDVVGGAFLGTLFGIAATEVLSAEQNVFGRLSVRPYMARRFGGATLELSF